MKASGQSSHGHPSRVSVVAYLPPLTSRKAWHAWSMLLCVWLSVTVRFLAEQKKETRQSQQTHDLR